LRNWKKLPQPIIATPPAGMNITGFRDPAPWRDGDNWYMVVASGVAKKGGMVLLYRSSDLRQWKYLHPLASGTFSGKSGSNPVDTGEMWECPDFFPLGNKHVLIHSTEGKTFWQSGELDKKEMVFHAERTGQLDYGSYYAPKTQLDANGNRILWGWITEARPEAEYSAAGWAGIMSLPRLLSLDSGELRMQPATQVATLRRPADSRPASASHLLNTMQEVICKLTTAGATGPLSFQIGHQHGTLLDVRSQLQQDQKTIRIDDTIISLSEPLPPQAELHVFIDNSVMEIFIDGRYAVTKRFYNRTAGKPTATITFAGSWRITDQQAHSLNSIWPRT
jgi:beta-fructofuranosidase